MGRLIAFAAASVGFLRLSWRSLSDPASHGFYRFFAFEAIAGLIALNVRQWFDRPFSPRQILSWVLLVSSAGLAVHGFFLLRVVGRPLSEAQASDGLIRGLENTSQLVRTGAYRYIRHPLYASLMYLAWGAFLKRTSRIARVLVATATVSLAAAAKVEEAENRVRFGPAYQEYADATKMFVPFLL